MEKTLLTAKDVAEKLQISLSMVYLLIERKELKAVHIGRAKRIRPEDLEKFIENNVH
jgi:excisionase family DNA binding protein